MENWVGVCEYNREEKDLIEWLVKLLEEEKIPYKEEFKENWFGYRKPMYQDSIIIYVPNEYKEKVESFLKEYNNPSNIVYEDVEELRNVSNDEEELLKERKKWKMIEKMFCWIPLGMVLIAIILMIIIEIMKN